MSKLSIFWLGIIVWLIPSAAYTDRATINTIVVTEAKRHSIPVNLIHAVIKTESAYKATIVSHAGAMGLMQLMPATAKRFNVSNAFDPKQNIRAGVQYLRILKNQFETWPLTLAAYNAGEGRVLQYKGIPPFRETRQYIVKVLSQYDFNLIPLSLLPNDILSSQNHQITLNQINAIEAKASGSLDAYQQSEDIYKAGIFFDLSEF